MRPRAVWFSALALAAAHTPDRAASPDVCPPKDVTSLLASTSHQICPVPTQSPEADLQSPWTHKPRCTTADTETYCVFTSSTFGSNGLSLIASPEAASAFTPILNRIYHSSFPSKASVRNLNLQPAFEVQDIPGKGKGLIATRHVTAKETFLIDHAALVVKTGFLQEVEKGVVWGMLDEAVDRLVDPDVVRSLDAMGRSGNTVEDVLQTNTFNSDLEIGRTFEVFPLISRVNHACKPNSFIRYSRDGLVAGVSAFRDIEPGEEITISYIALQEPSQNRKDLLQKNWNFACKCPLCTSPSSALSADDAKRSSLQTLEAEAISSIYAKNLPVAMERLARLAEAFMSERLWPLLQDIYHVLATVSWVMGRQEEAIGYVKMKLDIRDDYGRLEAGDRGQDMEEEMRVVARPR